MGGNDIITKKSKNLSRQTPASDYGRISSELEDFINYAYINNNIFQNKKPGMCSDLCMKIYPTTHVTVELQLLFCSASGRQSGPMMKKS